MKKKTELLTETAPLPEKKKKSVGKKVLVDVHLNNPDTSNDVWELRRLWLSPELIESLKEQLGLVEPKKEKSYVEIRLALYEDFVKNLVRDSQSTMNLTLSWSKNDNETFSMKEARIATPRQLAMLEKQLYQLDVMEGK